MQDLEALRAALYLFHLPSGIRSARERSLPMGIPTLLAVAAGESQATEAAAERLERQHGVMQQAAAFYIEQILLAPDVDAYRVLGAERVATDAELRRNMALLLRWVHPDMDRAGERSVYAGRVTGAWEALKTPERRAAYNAANPVKPAKQKSSDGKRNGRSGSGSGSSSGQARGSQAGAAKKLRADQPAGLLRIVLRKLLGSGPR